eukprot:2558877-Prymnesium_polylepis.1
MWRPQRSTGRPWPTTGMRVSLRGCLVRWHVGLRKMGHGRRAGCGACAQSTVLWGSLASIQRRMCKMVFRGGLVVC